MLTDLAQIYLLEISLFSHSLLIAVVRSLRLHNSLNWLIIKNRGRKQQFNPSIHTEIILFLPKYITGDKILPPSGT